MEINYEDLATRKICSICFTKYEEFGNNAWPINLGTCCDKCNNSLVIPARINLKFIEK